MQDCSLGQCLTSSRVKTSTTTKKIVQSGAEMVFSSLISSSIHSNLFVQEENTTAKDSADGTHNFYQNSSYNIFKTVKELEGMPEKTMNTFIDKHGNKHAKIPSPRISSR